MGDRRRRSEYLWTCWGVFGVPVGGLDNQAGARELPGPCWDDCGALLSSLWCLLKSFAVSGWGVAASLRCIWGACGLPSRHQQHRRPGPSAILRPAFFFSQRKLAQGESGACLGCRYVACTEHIPQDGRSMSHPRMESIAGAPAGRRGLSLECYLVAYEALGWAFGRQLSGSYSAVLLEVHLGSGLEGLCRRQARQ